MSRPLSANAWQFSRRRLLHYAAGSLAGLSASGWLSALADEVASDPRRRRQCVLLWMAGGPTQTDTFDMKPGHAHGGEFKEVATSVPGLRFSEHLPTLASQADKLCVLRGLSTKEGDHDRGTYTMRTGHQPGGPIRYPALGAALAKELARDYAELPNYVTISPGSIFSPAAFSPGFLGPAYAAATVGVKGGQTPPPAGEGFVELGVDNLQLSPNVDAKQFASRKRLWELLQHDFLASRRVEGPVAQDTVYRRAIHMMNSEALAAFDLSQEPEKIRQAYGRGFFGQGCLLARRLIERGVPFVEVTLGPGAGADIGWDTHQNNFPAVKALSEQLDAGWGTLMRELAERGLLETTTIAWMGEFGRTPKINENAGRDHFPAAWTCVLGGGGIRGGQAIGKTSEGGTEVVEGKVDVGDVLSTLCHALGVSPDHENISEEGRPIKIAEGKKIEAALA